MIKLATAALASIALAGAAPAQMSETATNTAAPKRPSPTVTAKPRPAKGKAMRGASNPNAAISHGDAPVANVTTPQ